MIELGMTDGTTTWQPIETAPLDKIIQLWRAGKWDVGKFQDDRYAKYPKPFWEGYYTHWNGLRWMRLNPPTHWMDVPAAPTEPPPP